MSHIETLKTFNEDTLPTLDVAVLGALELFEDTSLLNIDLVRMRHPLVLGSGNAATVGRILFAEHDAIFADESTAPMKLRNARDGIHNAVIISASGAKHAHTLAEDLKSRHIETWLLTNNEDAPAKEVIPDDHVFVFPRNREPYTYNTSTYMGMLLTKTNEDPHALRTFIEDTVSPAIPDRLGAYDAFYAIVPAEFDLLRAMMRTKFDELFGARVTGRVFTLEQSKHAKTVVPSESECFISFGEENTVFGPPKDRVTIPLPEGIGYAGMMAIAYYVIGRIQAQHPPYFAEHIAAYVKRASTLFGHEIPIIVE